MFVKRTQTFVRIRSLLFFIKNKVHVRETNTNFYSYSFVNIFYNKHKFVFVRVFLYLKVFSNEITNTNECSFVFMFMDIFYNEHLFEFDWLYFL